MTTKKDTDTRNIYQRMMDAGRAIGVMEKDKRADSAPGKYPFTSHDSVAYVVRKACFENGVVPIASVKEWGQDGNRTTCTMTVRYINADNPDDYIEIEAFGYGIDSQDKGPGKAMSYATKYAHLKALSIPSGLDVEDDNIEHKPAPESDPKYKRQLFDALVANHGKEAVAKAIKEAGFNNLKDVPGPELERISDSFETVSF